MNKVVYKYALDLNVVMPVGAQILTIDTQEGKPFIWALVDPTAEVERRHFRVSGTGDAFNADGRSYIATYREGPFVWHVFEVQA